VTETQFYLPDPFPTQESAIEAATQAGRQKIDAGFGAGTYGRERLSTGFHPPVPAPANACSKVRLFRSRARLFFPLVSGSLLAGARRVQNATLPVSRFDVFLGIFERFRELPRVPECDFVLFRSTRTRTR
jgi:hypothetical protein